MQHLLQCCQAHLEMLCNRVGGRSVGSPGNRQATSYFERIVSGLGWSTSLQSFDAMDWIDGGASLVCGSEYFNVAVSPYSLGCTATGKLVCASNVVELETLEINGNLLLLHGEIAKEQLMPKNFVFYNPDEHKHIISLLEQGSPLGIICATSRNASLAGGVYPFPLIEDGDFDIPSVYMTEEEGVRLLPFTGRRITLKSVSARVPGTGCNVLARAGNPSGERLVITAHIDAKKGTPGALDNASGVVILLLLADLLKDYSGDRLVELVAFNGEDYYAVPGQMRYIEECGGDFTQVMLNINIDGAGFNQGKSAFSFYNLPEELEGIFKTVLGRYDGITEGQPWVQGDHSIFIQFGRPAVAVSSQWFTDNIDSQEITHTPRDTIDILDCQKLVEISQALSEIIYLL